MDNEETAIYSEDDSNGSSSEDDSNKTPIENKNCWTPEDDYRLISQIYLQLPKTDDLPFIKRLDTIDWDKIIIRNWSVKDKKWRVMNLMESTRKFRVLREVLSDAKSVILDNIKLPKRLYPAFYLFVSENKDKFDFRKSLKKQEYSKECLEAFLSLSLKDIKNYKLRANGDHTGFQMSGPAANTSDLCSNALNQTPFKLFFKEQKKANIKVSKLSARNRYNALSDNEKLNWMMKSLNITKGEKLDLNTYKKAKKLFTIEEKNILDDYEGRPKCLPAYKLFMKDIYKKRGTGEVKKGWSFISEEWKKLPSEQKAIYTEKSKQLKSRYDGEIKLFLEKLPPDRRAFEIFSNKLKIEIDDCKDDNDKHFYNPDVHAVMNGLLNDRSERKRSSKVIIVEESGMPSEKKKQSENIVLDSSELSDSSDVEDLETVSKVVEKKDNVVPLAIRISQQLKTKKKPLNRAQQRQNVEKEKNSSISSHTVEETSSRKRARSTSSVDLEIELHKNSIAKRKEINKNIGENGVTSYKYDLRAKKKPPNRAQQRQNVEKEKNSSISSHTVEITSSRKRARSTSSVDLEIEEHQHSIAKRKEINENIGENCVTSNNEIPLLDLEKISSSSETIKEEFLDNTPFSLFFKERKIANPNCKYEESRNLYKNLKNDEKLYWMLKVLNVKKGEKIDANRFKKARQLFSKDEMCILNEYEGRPKRESVCHVYFKQRLETTKNTKLGMTMKDKWKALSEENKSLLTLEIQKKYQKDYKIFLKNLLPDRQKLELEEKGPKMLGILSSTANKVEDCNTSVLDKTYSNFRNIDAHSTVIKQTQLSDESLDFNAPERHNNSIIIAENSESHLLPSFIIDRPPNSVCKFYKKFIYKGSDVCEARLLYEALNDEEKEIVCRQHIEAKQKYLQKFEDYLKTLSFDEMKKFARMHSC